MPIFGKKSSFLEFGILAVQKRELIIEEVHSEFMGRELDMHGFQLYHVSDCVADWIVEARKSVLLRHEFKNNKEEHTCSQVRCRTLRS